MLFLRFLAFVSCSFARQFIGVPLISRQFHALVQELVLGLLEFLLYFDELDFCWKLSYVGRLKHDLWISVGNFET